jgi:diguanylate cyclase (GGDEF)-like protein
LITLVGAAVQNAIKADTYFLGTMRDNKTIDFDLIFDGGEYFPASKISVTDTLSGWVIRNHHSLFIPDVRSEIKIEGAKFVPIGKNETSRSWIGVPMKAGCIDGIIAVGSYKPNYFDRTDLELLENLGQQAALALDNASHHEKVEAQSHTDSLTGAYNHGYFLEVLTHTAEQVHLEMTTLSLIMLDIDHFKQYNDNYGHLVGDQVLTILTDAIRAHIHANDSIGRWGGEEFVILLPNTGGLQALVVAERIRKTMSEMFLQGRDGKHLPVPTVSQGIAVFPQETDDASRLIDLADQRLYLAKERGRDQIEPDKNHWKRLK